MSNNRIGNMAIQLGLSLTKFTSDWNRAEKLNRRQSRKLQKDMEQSMKAISAAVTGSVAALGLFITKTASSTDNLSKMSQKLGVSIDFLSKYDFITGQAGASIETLGTGIKKMEKSINDANNGLSTSTRALNSIGVSLEELNRLSPEQQFEVISAALSKVERQSVKTGAAMDIFGRAGTDLIPLFEISRQEIDKLNESNERFGAVINQVQEKVAVDYTDAMDGLKRNAQGLTQTISFALMPALTEMAKQFNDSTVRDSSDQYDVLNSILIGTYSVALDLNTVFASVGKALGQVAAHSINSFKLMGSGLEIFIKRVERGALIIGSVFSDDAAQSESRLGKEIAALENGFNDLLETIGEADNQFKSVGFFDSLDANEKKVNKVRAAYEKFKNDVKDSAKVLKETSNVLGNVGINAGLSTDELKKLGDNFNAIAESLLDPLEKLELQYKKDIETLQEWQKANLENDEILGKANLLIVERTEKFEKDTKAIKANQKALKDQKTPYQQLIQSLKDELELVGKKGIELQKVTAKQELSRLGITAATVGQEEYNKMLQQYLLIIGQIEQKSSKISFDQKITGVSDLISSIESMSEAFENFGDDIGRGLQNVGRSIQSALNSIASISPSFGDSGIFKTLGNIAGSASVVGQVAGFINNLTGGNLFGTSYATDSTTQNFGIGPSGGTGFLETRESKKRPLFGGTKRRTTVSDLAAQAQKDIESLFATIENIIATSSLAVGGNLEELISGAFKQTFDKDGNLKSEFSTVLGQTYNETFGEFSQRLIAENIIAVLDSVLPQVEHTVTNYIRDFENIEFGSPGLVPVTTTQLTGEANALADQYRDLGAESLLEFANFALKAVEDIQQGNELLESLTDTTALIEDLGKANETLSQTYDRVAGSTQIFENALETIGITFDQTREEFIRFSVDITEAAGGLQEASNLWQSYFNTFYTAEELLQQQIENATALRDDLLSDLGLDSNISIEAFREQFESLLPTLTPEQVTQWLQAGQAIGVVLDLSSDIAEQAEQNASDLRDELARLAQQAEENAAELAGILDDVASAMEDLDLSPFAKRLKEITKAFNEQIKTARELGATEQELAMIQAYATRQIQDAINALESNIRTSINDLYGTQLDVINEQIASLEQQQSLSQQLAQESEQRYRDEIAALQNLAGYIDSLFLNPTLTTLNPFEQLQEAQSQFDELFAQAQNGDASAINALPGIADLLLGLGRENFASSPAFTALFDTITGQLQSLGLGGPSTSLDNFNTADPRLLELQAQQKELLSEIATQERFQEVLALAGQIAELNSVVTQLNGATQESFTELAERLGLPIERFVTDLGVNLDELTIDTATALTDVAQLLGIELTELADSVGVSLGDLADSESLLNDALEAAINTLPEGIQGTLGGLLEDVENAADGTDRLEKLALLEEYANSLPSDQRDELAPFFNQIDPTTDAQRQIDSIGAVNETNQQIQLGINTLSENNTSGFNNVEQGVINLTDQIAGLRSEIVTLVAQGQS